MARSSPGTHRLPLGLALLFGIVALLLAGIGLFRPGFDFSPEGWDRLSDLLFKMAAVLSLDQPSPAPSNGWFAAARIFAVLFAASAAIGIVLELYRPASDAWLRFRYRVSRYVTRLARKVPLPSWLRKISLGPVQKIVSWLDKMRDKQSVTLIGLGWIGGQLANELRGWGWPVYGLEWEEESPAAIEARRSKTLVIVGDATEPAVRRRAGLEHAAEVFIATGDDVRNVEIAGDLLLDAQEERLGRRSKEGEVQCYVHVGDPALSSSLRRHQLLQGLPGKIAIHLFSNPEHAARQLFLDPEAGLALRHDYAPRPGEVFHLFVFGFGMTGQAVALHAARFAHFAGTRPGTAFRPRVTVFEAFHQPERALERERFFDRFPAFAPLNLSFDPVGPDTDATIEGKGVTTQEAVAAQRASFFTCFEVDGSRDGWAARPGRPAHQDFRQRPHVLLEPLPKEYDVDPTGYRISEQEMPVPKGRDRVFRWVRPVEYAVNAEFISLRSDIEAQEVVDAIENRLSPDVGPAVRAAAVVCFEEEREGFHAALRLRHALARRYTKASRDGPLLPIYVYLPVEEGLVEQLETRRVRKMEDCLRVDEKNRLLVEDCLFPLHAFGRQEEVTAYDAITRGDIRRRAHRIASTYRVFAGQRDEAHHDFQTSNEDSALHASLKFAALGIQFEDPSKTIPTEADHRRKRLLSRLMDASVVEKHREYEKKEYDGCPCKPQWMDPVAGAAPGEPEAETAVPAATRDDFEAVWPTFGKPDPDGPADLDWEALWQRLALLERVYIPKLDDIPPEESARRKCIKDFEKVVRDYAVKAIELFESELPGGRNCADIAAEMEHNRWMSERLSRGWRFGERDHDQRHTMIPWDELTPEEKHYDRAHLPGLILERGPSALSPEKKAVFAYITLPDVPEEAGPPPGARMDGKLLSEGLSDTPVVPPADSAVG